MPRVLRVRSGRSLPHFTTPRPMLPACSGLGTWLVFLMQFAILIDPPNSAMVTALPRNHARNSLLTCPLRCRLHCKHFVRHPKLLPIVPLLSATRWRCLLHPQLARLPSLLATWCSSCSRTCAPAGSARTSSASVCASAYSRARPRHRTAPGLGRPRAGARGGCRWCPSFLRRLVDNSAQRARG